MLFLPIFALKAGSRLALQEKEGSPFKRANQPWRSASGWARRGAAASRMAARRPSPSGAEARYCAWAEGVRIGRMQSIPRWHSTGKDGSPAPPPDHLAHIQYRQTYGSKRIAINMVPLSSHRSRRLCVRPDRADSLSALREFAGAFRPKFENSFSRLFSVGRDSLSSRLWSRRDYARSPVPLPRRARPCCECCWDPPAR